MTSDMTQSTLVETYRHNLQTALLVQMGVAEYHTWKQVVLQGEQVEEMIAGSGLKKKTANQDTTNQRCEP